MSKQHSDGSLSDLRSKSTDILAETASAHTFSTPSPKPKATSSKTSSPASRSPSTASAQDLSSPAHASSWSSKVKNSPALSPLPVPSPGSLSTSSALASDSTKSAHAPAADTAKIYSHSQIAPPNTEILNSPSAESKTVQSKHSKDEPGNSVTVSDLSFIPSSSSDILSSGSSNNPDPPASAQDVAEAPESPFVNAEQTSVPNTLDSDPSMKTDGIVSPGASTTTPPSNFTSPDISSSVPITYEAKGTSKSNDSVIAGATVSAVVALIVILLLILRYRKKRIVAGTGKSSQMSTVKSISGSSPGMWSTNSENGSYSKLLVSPLNLHEKRPLFALAPLLHQSSNIFNPCSSEIAHTDRMLRSETLTIDDEDNVNHDYMTQNIGKTRVMTEENENSVRSTMSTFGGGETSFFNMNKSGKDESKFVSISRLHLERLRLSQTFTFRESGLSDAVSRNSDEVDEQVLDI